LGDATAPRYAVISAGTNSCRFLIASLEADGPHPLYHETRGTRLGEGVDERRRLSPDAVERTLAVVRDYAALAHGVATTFGIGTSALRDASDGDAFAERFSQAAGVPLAILSGEEEAQSSFAGAMCGLRAAGRSAPDVVSVIDVGGGSTEIAVRSSANIEPQTASLQIGAVRLTEQHLVSDPPEAPQVERCRLEIRTALRGLAPETAPRGLVVAVGGTANTAARILQLLDEKDPSGVADIPATDLAALLKATLSMPLRERLRLRGLPAQRADIFPAGLIILDEVVRLASSASLTVCESDLLLGYMARHA